MSSLVSALFLIAGATLGGLFGLGWTSMGEKVMAGRLEMWRLGAEAGPTPRDREIARRRYDRQARDSKWLMPIVVWGFRIFSPLFGGLFGLALAGNVGGLK